MRWDAVGSFRAWPDGTEVGPGGRLLGASGENAGRAPPVPVPPASLRR